MKKILTISLLFLLQFTSCGDDYQSSIPDVRVNFSCSLLQSPYSVIQIPGSFLKVTKDNHGIGVGYGGIIIGQSIYGGYAAFDAACPVEISRDVSVNIQNDGLGTAVCPKCGTKYNLSEGGFPEGEGTEYLKRYTINASGTTLRVSN